jgi:hypothetical protein
LFEVVGARRQVSQFRMTVSDARPETAAPRMSGPLCTRNGRNCQETNGAFKKTCEECGDRVRRLLRRFPKAGQFGYLAGLARPFGGGRKRGSRQGSGIVGECWYLTRTEASSDVDAGLPNTMTAVTHRDYSGRTRMAGEQVRDVRRVLRLPVRLSCVTGH